MGNITPVKVRVHETSDALFKSSSILGTFLTLCGMPKYSMNYDEGYNKADFDPFFNKLCFASTVSEFVDAVNSFIKGRQYRDSGYFSFQECKYDCGHEYFEHEGSCVYLNKRMMRTSKLIDFIRITATIGLKYSSSNEKPQSVDITIDVFTFKNEKSFDDFVNQDKINTDLNYSSYEGYFDGDKGYVLGISAYGYTIAISSPTKRYYNEKAIKLIEEDIL